MIFLKKRATVMEDPEFQKKPKAEQEQILQFKSDTFNAMEKMIESIKKYREDYCGSREPRFIRIKKPLRKRKSKAGGGKRRASVEVEAVDGDGGPSRSESPGS